MLEATSLSTLKEKDFVREEGLNLVPALNRQSGILVHSGALNTNRITIRGIGSRSPFATAKIRAYIDEIPLTNGVGETILEDIDPSVIRRVDIVKGPASSRYGAGLGGLIHLKTLNSTAYEHSYAGSSLTLGSYGLQHHTHQLHTRSADQKLGIHLSAQRVHSDGWRGNSEYDRVGGMLLSRWAPDERSQLTFLVGAWRLKAFIPSSLNLSDFLNSPERAAPNWAAVAGYESYDRQLGGLSYQYQWSPGWQSTVSIFSQYRRAYEPRPFNILREQSRAMGARLNIRYDSPQEKRWQTRWQTGAEVFSENHLWQTNVILPSTNPGALLSDLEEQRRYVNAFTDLQLHNNGRWILEAGLNANVTGYDLTDHYFPDSLNLSGIYRFEPIISPRFSLAYELVKVIALQAYAVVSHGFSTPTLEETLAPDGAINPAIKPERGWNREFGFRGRSPASWLRYEVSAYSMTVRDLLVARRTAEDQYVGINAGRTLHRGLEVQVFGERRFETAPGNGHVVEGFVSYTRADYRFVEFIDDGQDYSGNQLTGTARDLLRAGLDYAWHWQSVNRIYTQLSYQYVGAMPVRDDNEIFSDAWQVWTLRAGVEKSIGSRWMLHFYGGINNLTDQLYASMLQINAGSFGVQAPRYYYPGMPRNFFAGLQVRYSW